MNGQPAQVQPNRKTHRLKIVVFVLVGLIALYTAYRLSLSFAIKRRLDSIHRAGLPATGVEWDKWYVQPPAGENAADVFREAFAHYNSWTNKDEQFSVPADAKDKTRFYSPPESKRDLLPVVGMAKLPPRTEPLPAEVQKLVAEYLSDNAEALRLLHKAAAMKSCRYPIDLTKGINTLLPHLNSLRQAARLLELETIQHIEEQKPQAAVESVIASLGVSRSLNQEPILISYLVHAACQAISFDSLERILNRIPLTDEQLAKMAATIQESENQQSLTRAFVGERCCGVSVFEGLRTGKIPMKDMISYLDNEAPWYRMLFPLYRTTGLLALDERSYLDMMDRFVKATRLSLPESIAASHAVDKEAGQVPRWCVLTPMLLPPPGAAMNKAGRYDAKTRDAQTALALERYRLTHGKLPSQLSDLVPSFLSAVPRDPFDGKPLRYKTLAKGYVVYSVGEDREDNGGAEKNSKGVSYGPGTDITFTVER